MLYAIVLIVTVVLLAIIISSPLIVWIYWYRKGVSTVSPISLFGYSANMLKKEPLFINLRHFYTTMKENGKQYGGYVFFMKPIFVPIDLNLIKQMLMNDFDHFTDHIGHVDAENDPLTLHLFNTKGWHWKKMRSRLTSSFTSAKLKMMFDTALKCGQDFKELIDNCEDKSIDIKDVSERFTTDVIVSYGFGVESKALRNNTSEFRRLSSEALKSFRIFLAQFFPGLVSLLKIQHFSKKVTDFFINLVEETVKYRKQVGIVREDYMHQLLQSRTPNSDVNEIKSKDGLSLNEIAAQCFIFYGAGYETTAAAISFTLTELAINQRIQNKVRDEIRAVLQKHNGRITYEAVQEMDYLNKCLYESLRKYPPVPTNTRICTKSYRIPNCDVVIDKGTYVLIPTYALHRDPEHFPNPDEYDPDRFSKREAKNREPPAFMPFGDGPRKCIGYKFAIVNSLVPLVILIKHFKFYPHPDVKVPFRFSTTFFLNTLNPLKVIAEKVEE